MPPLDTFKAVLEPTTEGREISTTQAFVRFLTQLLRDKELGPRAVPILVDEARTFGMEGLFRQIGIYNPAGQNYTPVDRDQVMYYREDKAGQVLQEGINEPGGMSSWIAAATSYSTNNRIMVPFYVYYSMFGFQRVGDLAWAAGDMQARGFLLGGTSGRTTLNGEGLQHEDGHSHILAGTIPNCISYDPTFAHEVGVILHHGLVRMVEKQDNVFFYLTLLNENYAQPGLRAGTEDEIIKGMYLLQEGAKKAPRVNLLGSGTILRESMAAKELLENDWGIAANVWSCPSFNQLARDGQAVERWNLLHPTERPRVAVRRPAAREVRRPGDRLDRLHEELRRADPRPPAEGPDLQGAGHRRLRPQRLPHQAARALRGRPALRRRRRAEGAGRGRQRAGDQGGRGDRQVRDRRRQDQPALRLKDRAMATVEVKVPDIGDFKDVEIIEVLVKPGDRIKAEQSLVTVESDKASMEIPSSAAGVVKELRSSSATRSARARRCWCWRPRAGPSCAPRPPAGTAAPRGPAARAASPRRRRAERPRPACGRAAAARRPIEVVVPDIGDFDEVAVIEVLVKPGDTVKVEQSLITVESDKASMEIPSSHAGVVKDAQGQGRRQGVQGQRGRDARRRRRRRAADRAGRRAAPRAAAAAAAAPRAPRPPRRAGREDGRRPPRCRRTSRPRRKGALPHASPTIRKLARELGVPLDEVKGSGPKGRITQEDVQGFVKARDGRHARRPRRRRRRRRRGAPPAAAAFPGLLAWPQVDFTKFGADRAQGPVADQEDQRRQPASQLGADPARHQPRRRRHHRARGVPRRDQQGEREVRASR